jgi:hypothetical protein
LLQLASEYDIREIDEALYEAVLAKRKAINADTASDLDDSEAAAQVPLGGTMGQ